MVMMIMMMVMIRPIILGRDNKNINDRMEKKQSLSSSCLYHHDNRDVEEVEKRAETPAPVAATPQSTRKDETVVDVQVMMMTMLL